MSILQNKPYFSLKISAKGCAYDFRINDAPIFNSNNGSVVNTTIPVNEWMLTGTNNLSIHLTRLHNEAGLSKFDDQCLAKATLLVRESGQPENSNIALSELTFSSDGNNLSASPDNIQYEPKSGSYNLYLNNKIESNSRGNIYLYKPIIKMINHDVNNNPILIERIIELPQLALPDWSWQHADKLENNTNTKDQLNQQIKKIWSAIHKKDASMLKSLLHQRSEELAKAYYTTPEQVSVIPSLQSILNDTDYEQLPLYPNDSKLKVYANGKLAELINDWYPGGDVILFNNKKSNSHRAFKLIFAKINNKWAVVR